MRSSKRNHDITLGLDFFSGRCRTWAPARVLSTCSRLPLFSRSFDFFSPTYLHIIPFISIDKMTNYDLRDIVILLLQLVHQLPVVLVV